MLSCESFYILSHRFLFVKNFFKNFFHLLFEDFCSLRCELLYVITRYLICQELFNFLLRFSSFFFQKYVSRVQRIYNIITLYSRQAFFEYFFIFSKSTRYCTFSVFLSFILQIRLARLLLFYQFNKLSNSDYPTKAKLE